MKLVEDAFEEVKEGLLKASQDEDGHYRWRNKPLITDYVEGNDVPGQFTRLRLDWELAWTDEDKANEQVPVFDEHIADLMMLQAKTDIADLLENGDVYNSGDALLKAINGSKVRGTDAKKVSVAEAVMKINPVPKKESTEYTVYINLYTEW